jgi:hypothetical protein
MSIPTLVQELIDGSGNNFHAKVARWFMAEGWRVSVSPYYMDQTQQKAREIDLVVEKSVSIAGGLGDVVVRLFVECKFVPGYSVFWFTSKNKKAVEQVLCTSGPFRPNNQYTNKHHYLVGDRVAKLFTSSNNRGPDAEPFYKALNQALNGLVSLRLQSAKGSRPAGSSYSVLAVLDFPLVVCSSFAKMFSADFDGQRETEEIRENFQLEVEYAYVSPAGHAAEELFLLDFVEYDQLPAIAAALETDARVAGFLAT